MNGLLNEYLVSTNSIPHRGPSRHRQQGRPERRLLAVRKPGRNRQA